MMVCVAALIAAYLLESLLFEALVGDLGDNRDQESPNHILAVQFLLGDFLAAWSLLCFLAAGQNPDPLGWQPRGGKEGCSGARRREAGRQGGRDAGRERKGGRERCGGSRGTRRNGRDKNAAPEVMSAAFRYYREVPTYAYKARWLSNVSQQLLES